MVTNCIWKKCFHWLILSKKLKRLRSGTHKKLCPKGQHTKNLGALLVVPSVGLMFTSVGISRTQLSQPLNSIKVPDDFFLIQIRIKWRALRQWIVPMRHCANDKKNLTLTQDDYIIILHWPSSAPFENILSAKNQTRGCWIRNTQMLPLINVCTLQLVFPWVDNAKLTCMRMTATLCSLGKSQLK